MDSPEVKTHLHHPIDSVMPSGHCDSGAPLFFGLVGKWGPGADDSVLHSPCGRRHTPAPGGDSGGAKGISREAFIQWQKHRRNTPICIYETRI
jgi:hypothetical protein